MHNSVDILADLISYNTVNTERPLAEHIRDILQNAGFQTKVQVLPSNPERANVIASIGNPSGRKIMFEGHIDVVPATGEWNHPPFEPVIEDGKLYGRGSSDMKGGVASMIAAALDLRNDPLLEMHQLILLFVCDEEVFCQGIKHFLTSDDYVKADFAVIGEPTDNLIALCHRGSCHFTISVKGRSAHAAQASEGINAIYQAMRVIELVKTHCEELSSLQHEFLDSPCISATTIHAGTLNNLVPDVCDISVDIRTLPGVTADDAIRPLVQKLDHMAAEDSDFHYTIEKTQEAHGGEQAKDSPLANAARKARMKIFGEDRDFIGFGVTCEQAFLTESGTPTIIYGPGECAQAHTTDEYIPVDNLALATEFYMELFRTLCLE